MKTLLGKKLGMIRIFNDQGRAIGATAVEILPATVLRIKTVDKDGYTAMQVGVGARKQAGKAWTGAGGGTAYEVIREFPTLENVTPGKTIGIDQLKAGQRVTVTAVSKGKGFQGTVKRHNFSRGPKTHGSRNYRAPGSIGGTGAARVFPGQKMPGRMGARTVTAINLKVAAIHSEETSGNGVVLLEGSVPGPIGKVVTIKVRD